MTVRDEASDPWAWLLAAVSGGLTWAVVDTGVGLVAGIGVGAAVFFTKVAVGAATSRGRAELPRRPDADSLPRAPRNSQAAVFLARAEAARSRMAEIAQRPGDAWLRAEVGRMDDGADAVVDSMRDLAGRVTLADQLLAAADGHALQADRDSLAAQVAQTADPVLAQERQRALVAVEAQLAGLHRLEGLRDQLLARMQTAAVGMETVATRMGEVVTLGTAAMEHDRAGDLLSDAGHDLEALRTGLAEAQRLARGVGT